MCAMDVNPTFTSKLLSDTIPTNCKGLSLSFASDLSSWKNEVVTPTYCKERIHSGDAPTKVWVSVLVGDIPNNTLTVNVSSSTTVTVRYLS